MKFRKKPVVIDAVQWTGDNLREVRGFLGDDYIGIGSFSPSNRILIDTLEGAMSCPIGHWVIRGVRGEHYACEPEIFAETYEAVDDEVPA